MNARGRNLLLIAMLFCLAAGACTFSTGQARSGYAAGTAQSLTIYTGRDKEEVTKVIDLFTQKYPKYKGKVDAVLLGAQAALERLRAEQSNPEAGFLWGGTRQGLQQAANEQLLAASNPLNGDLIACCPRHATYQ